MTSKSYDVFSLILSNKETQVNCQDGDGNTGLMLAICYKKQPVVDILLAEYVLDYVLLILNVELISNRCF